MSAVCPHCGAPLRRSDARFCVACGSTLSGAPAPPASQSPIAPKPPPTQRIGTGQSPQLLIQMAGLPCRIEALTIFPVILGSNPTPGVIAIQHHAVAARHARLEQQGAEIAIVDLGSVNGTTVNGRPLKLNTAHSLTDGAVIRIADAQGNSVGIQFRSGASAPVASVQLGKLQLDARGVATLGRDPGNDVKLDHPSVSRFHAEVRRTPKGDILTVTTGVYVIWRPCARPALTEERRCAPLGPFKLTYVSIR
ncbi:MAG: FHA domain-containing protein [Caldilineaceae bacterium]|nr:FHA domain-containing protein [Caldilineaceae bacterium]